MEVNLGQWLPLHSERLFHIILGADVCCEQLDTCTNTHICYMVTLIHIIY